MAIAVLDIGYGNRLSLAYALTKNDIPFFWANEPISDDQATAFLLPGVGSARSALAKMNSSGWSQRLLSSQKPIIGICLGFQMLFERLQENGSSQGLGIFNGTVNLLENPTSLVPHLGWNEVRRCPNQDRDASSLFENLETDFYFAHSFATHESSDALLSTDGFVSAAAKGKNIGFQFHPELSGEAGDELLRRLWRWCKSFQQST